MSTNALSTLLDTEIEIVDQRPLGGGCISEVSMVTVRSPSGQFGGRLQPRSCGDQQVSLVIKRNRAEMVSNFRCEADGLRALAETNALRVPTVFAVDQIDDQAWIVMEWIPTRSGARKGDRNSNDLFADFGRCLARMHHTTAGSRIGWHSDNFLGSATQPNEPCNSWPEFFAQRRIGYQLRWACDQGLVDSKLKHDCESIVATMPELLSGRQDSTSLLHGDLWSGNYLFGEPSDGRCCVALIDPAVYYGCREAEWGMIKWFGNCPPEFEQGYQQEWAMPDGWQRRVAIYMLYHQLNHLNLFDGSYAATCRQTASQILRHH